MVHTIKKPCDINRRVYSRRNVV